MSSQTRRIQRQIIRQKCYKRDGNIKAFNTMWDEFHSAIKSKGNQNKDNSVVKANQKPNSNSKKKRLSKRLKFLKSKLPATYKENDANITFSDSSDKN